MRKEGMKENGRVASLETLSIFLQDFLCLLIFIIFTDFGHALFLLNLDIHFLTEFGHSFF